MGPPLMSRGFAQGFFLLRWSFSLALSPLCVCVCVCVCVCARACRPLERRRGGERQRHASGGEHHARSHVSSWSLGTDTHTHITADTHTQTTADTHTHHC